MSCEYIPSLLDLQNAKKNVDDFGRLMGTGAGTSTNGVTGQVRPTYNAVMANLGYTRVGTFAIGGVLTNGRQTLLWDVADGGDGQEYGWSGLFPLAGKVVPPGSTPLTTGGIAVGAWMSRFDPELRVQLREAQRRSYAEAGYNLVAGSFEVGGTLVNANDVLLHESTGKAFSGPVGTVVAGTNPVSGGFTDRSMEYLRSKSASGVSLSHVMHLPSPLETALELHREFGVELIIDCDCEYSYMLIKPGDSIRCVGWPTLTKINNSVPSVAPTQAPERPVGYLDDFAVNAFFVVYHEANDTTARVRISGGIKFQAGSSITLEKYAHIPRLAFSHISDIRADSQYISDTLDGFHFKDEYSNTIKDIHLLNAGMARSAFLWDDGTYGTGTSTTGEGLHAVGFRFPFRSRRHNYSTLTNCGGENVGTKDELGATLPIVFDLEDSCFTLNSPSTEHLHGGFIKVRRTDGGWPAAVTVNTLQANVAIYGSKDNPSAKLFDVDGGASVVVNGNFMTPAAAGYHLKSGGAKNDSSLQLNGFDPNFLMNDIKADTENYTGIHEVNCSRVAMSAMLYGIDGDYSTNGQLPFTSVANDDFGMKSGPSSFTVRRGMLARVSASLRSRPGTEGYASIKVNGAEKDRVYFLSSPTGESVTLSFDGRINGGNVVSLEINLASGAIAGNNWYDCKFSITQS